MPDPISESTTQPIVYESSSAYDADVNLQYSDVSEDSTTEDGYSEVPANSEAEDGAPLWLAVPALALGCSSSYLENKYEEEQAYVDEYGVSLTATFGVVLTDEDGQEIDSSYTESIPALGQFRLQAAYGVSGTLPSSDSDTGDTAEGRPVADTNTITPTEATPYGYENDSDMLVSSGDTLLFDSYWDAQSMGDIAGQALVCSEDFLPSDYYQDPGCYFFFSFAEYFATSGRTIDLIQVPVGYGEDVECEFVVNITNVDPEAILEPDPEDVTITEVLGCDATESQVDVF